MLKPAKVLEVELTRPLPEVSGIEGYLRVKVLVRVHGHPVGWATIPIVNGGCPGMAEGIFEQLNGEIFRRLCVEGLVLGQAGGDWTLERLLRAPLEKVDDPVLPRMTVVICTRDRTGDLRRCLEAVGRMDYPGLEVLVVDNAPSDSATEQLVREWFPEIRYVMEPRPGLDWARNRGIVEATGEIIAFTDDDVEPDSQWARVIGRTFAEEPAAMALTGLVVPVELETPAQEFFEMRGGFGKGFIRRWFRGAGAGKKLPWHRLGTGNCGTGANMAYRKILFTQIGGFDPALDVGTPTGGAGDLEMFFRTLKEGYDLVYEPAAMVRHRHRQDLEALKRQIFNNGSVFAYIRRSIRHYPDQRWQFVRLGCNWFFKSLVKAWIRAQTSPMRYPRELRSAEIRGCFRGLRTFPLAENQARRVIEKFGPMGPEVSRSPREKSHAAGYGICQVELSEPLQPLEDGSRYAMIRVYALWKGIPLGFIDLACKGQTVSVRQLAEHLVPGLGHHLYLPGTVYPVKERPLMMGDELRRILTGGILPAAATLDPEVPVSVVVGTFDRPGALRRCLTHLMAQSGPRPLQIVVTDNHPASGQTAPVVAEFPGVQLVPEPRQGVAYARNAGFRACRGDIIITTDDDVTMPSDWVEKLVAPFARPDIMLVNGNILPEELETASQRAFESYGGLGRGFEIKDFSSAWFERRSRQAVPTWSLGATANSAFRASALQHPEIGFLDEALGPGMPSGVGEDIYLYYKVLKAGYTVRYHGGAYVWHTHRRDEQALRRQLYGYSKGFVSYHLTTLFRDRDFRALFTLVFHLPRYHWSRIRASLAGRGHYPLILTFEEIRGNLMGPLALWQSIRRVRRERSRQTVPGVPADSPVRQEEVVAQPEEKAVPADH